MCTNAVLDIAAGSAITLKRACTHPKTKNNARMTSIVCAHVLGHAAAWGPVRCAEGRARPLRVDKRIVTTIKC